MQKFNIMRPLLILAVAYFANQLTRSISLLLGASPELAGNLGFLAMMAAVILTYMRIKKARNKH